MLVITPAANDNIRQIMFSDDRLNNTAEASPPNPVPQIPAIALNKISCNIFYDITGVF
jgi:hypothetical protein